MADTQTQDKPSKDAVIEIRNNTRQPVRLCCFEISKDGGLEGRHDDDIIIGDKADADIPDAQRTPETPNPKWTGPRSRIDKLPKSQRDYLAALVRKGDLELREV